jgi:hypothetical protein
MILDVIIFNLLLIVQVIKDNSHTFHNCVYIYKKSNTYTYLLRGYYENKIRN